MVAGSTWHYQLFYPWSGKNYLTMALTGNLLKILSNYMKKKV